MPTPTNLSISGVFGQPVSGASTGIFAEAAVGGDLFSQLLTGFDASTAGQGQQNLPGGNAAELLAPTPASLLAAQQVDAASADDAAALLTPHQAETLLADINAGTYGDPKQSELLQQLREQLADVAKGKEAKSLGEVAQAIAATKSEASNKLSQSSNLQRALTWLQAALKKSTDKEQALANANAQAIVTDPNLQSLQASHFRTRADASTRAEDKAQGDEKTKLENASASTIMVPQWVAAIAPEKPAANDNDTTLPKLELPKTHSKVPDALAQDRLDAAAQKLGVQEAAQQVANHSALMADHAAFKEHLAANDAYQLSDATSPVTTAAAAGGHVQTQTIHAPQAVSTVSLPPGVVNHAPVAEQVHVAVSRAKKDNIDHITLQLEPAHLGRVEVQMRMAQDGQTQITFVADKPETFDALSRDAHALERSLQEAGIKADAGSMQFNLRQQPQPQMGADMNFGNGGRQSTNSGSDSDEAKVAEVGALAPLVRQYSVNVQDGVDIHA